MKDKIHNALVNIWAVALITVVTLGLIGVIVALAQWILRLVGVL